MKKWHLLFSLVLFSSGVYAAEPTGSYTNFKLKVTAIVSMQSGSYVYFDTNHQCGAKTAFFERSRADFDTLYSSFLAAQTADKYVSVDLRDTSPGGKCDGAYSKVGNLCYGDESGPCFTGW